MKNDNLSERPAARAILALALTASLAAFGCTTNRTPGNGDPLHGAPGAGPGAPTSGVNGGSSSGTGTVNPPMTSSSTYNDALPTVSARSRKLPLSPDEAAAIMADNHLGRGVRVLGPVNPGSAGRTYASDGVVTGQFQNPALRLNPIVTVNSSVNSIAHVPAVAGGAVGGDAGGFADAATLGGGIASNATVAPGGTLGDGGGAVFSPATAVTTPTAAGLPLTPGTFAAGPGTTTGSIPGTTLASTSSGTLTPTVAAGGLPSPTVASSAITAATGTTRAAGTAATNATSVAPTVGGTTTVTNATARNTTTTNATRGTATRSNANATVASRSTARTTSASVANPVRISQDGNGRVTVTNSKSQK